MVKIFTESWNYWMLHFTAQENWRLRALVLVLFYFITMALTTHWFLSGLLSCLACCFSVDHQGGQAENAGWGNYFTAITWLPAHNRALIFLDRHNQDDILQHRSQHVRQLFCYTAVTLSIFLPKQKMQIYNNITINLLQSSWAAIILQSLFKKCKFSSKIYLPHICFQK